MMNALKNSLAYGLVFFAIGVLWFFSKWPYRILLKLGKGLGLLIFRFAIDMRRISKINVDLCFPELSEKERLNIIKGSFISLGIAFFEAGLAAFASKKRLKKLLHLQGHKHLEAAKKTGKGVILLGVHFYTLEMAGRLFTLDDDFGVVYRKHKKAFVNYFLAKIIRRHYPEMIERNNVRTLIQSLKKGRAIWYTPDIDAGYYDNVFVPFFGIKASSMTATARLAKLTGALVISCGYFRREDGTGYDLVINPPLQNFPSDNMEADIARINLETEDMVRRAPSQYMWQYKRFKSRPKGEKRLYKLEQK